jgi:cell division protein FtsW (lipid II flippase)
MRCVRITIVAVEKQYVLHILSVCVCVCVCVCSLRYPACNVHAPCYIVICGLACSTIFFHLNSNTGASYWFSEVKDFLQLIGC